MEMKFQIVLQARWLESIVYIMAAIFVSKNLLTHIQKALKQRKRTVVFLLKKFMGAKDFIINCRASLMHGVI
jgi:hypothetical protein